MKINISPRNENGSSLNWVAAFAISAAAISAVLWSVLSVNPQEVNNHALQDPQDGSKQYFSVVGSAGTVDDADTAIYNTGGSIIHVRRSTPAVAHVNVRYAVHAVKNLAEDFDDIDMDVRFRDNGTEAQVVVKLKEYDLATGATLTRLIFNSNNCPADNSYQKDSVSETNVAWQFDFANYIYYLDVVLIKTGENGNPALAGIIIKTSGD